jgi:hypothetical protein
VQGITLGAALAPVIPLAVSRSAVAVSLGLLVVSFGRDMIWLERGNAERIAADRIAAERTAAEGTAAAGARAGSAAPGTGGAPAV